MPALHSRRRLQAGLVALLLLSLSGCGQGGGSARDDAVSVVARGADRTLGARTFRFEATMDGGGQRMVMSGVADIDRKLAGTTLGVGATLPFDFITTEDGKTYQRREWAPRSMDVKTAWALIDNALMLRSLGALDTLDVPGTTSDPSGAMAMNPATMLDSLRKTAERVEREGRDVVRGVQTTRYAVTGKPRSSPTGTPVADDVSMGQEAMTIWVGDDGLVRRIDNRVTLPIEEGSPAGTFRSTVEFFDFGIPVNLEAPAASDTTDITERFAASFKGPTSDTVESASVRSWSTVTKGTVGRSRWTFQRGKASSGAVCTRLTLDPPVEVPSFPAHLVPPLPPEVGTPAVPVPPGLGTAAAPVLPDGSPLPLPPGLPAVPGEEPPLYSPSGEAFPMPPGLPPTFPMPSGEVAESSTVPGVGFGCGDLMTTHGSAADVGRVGWLFGVVPPGAEQATARFAGGAETPVAFHDGLFVLVHPAAQRLEQVTFARHGQPLHVCQRPPDGAPPGLPLC